ncbi:MAG: hypothetical protein ACXWH0_15170 [Acidimicrobiia bacterium]
MAEEEIGIVKLEPMRVAATLGFGSQPEIEAWDKLISWARAVNLLDGTQRFFGSTTRTRCRAARITATSSG